MTQTKPPRRYPFGLQRRHYLAIRVILVVGIVLVGATLHHHGAVYVAIRMVYLALVVVLIAWRLNLRRQRRADSGA
ncbi:MAG TPA: hypothetical protein VG652_06330 [Gaiellaceae bacterium]|nr:hypothetical protein [Gaiellaceae bacterium]